MDFSIESRQLDGPVYLVTVTGELDLSTAARFRAKLFDAVARGGRKLILDLRGVTFIDSTNIGTLMDAHRRADQHGGEVAVVCTDNYVLKVFGLVGIDRLFEIHESVETAAAEYALDPPGETSEERMARNQALFREVNERVEDVLSGEHGPVDFLCECGDPECLDAVPLTLEEYEAIRRHPDQFVVAEGHKTAGVERIVGRQGDAEVVEKTGRAGRIAEELDPRG